MLRADNPVVCPPRLGAIALLCLALSGCRGDIIFGPGDTGRPSGGDTGVTDNGGYPDATGYPDAAEDAGDAGDTGAPCVPGYPMTWPYERTGTKYWMFFGEWAVANGCSVSSCHGNLNANRDPPYYPAMQAELDVPGALDLAIGELWSSILPGDATSKLIATHDSAGLAKEPLYLTSQKTYLQQFVMDAAMPCPTTTTTPDAGDMMPDAGDPDGGPGDI